MVRRLVCLIAVAGLLVAGCAPAAPAPAPTSASAASPPTAAPAAPAKAAEPTKAPAAQPTAVPVQKVVFPEKGKPITWICPFPAGSANDFASRLVGAEVEKRLGTPVQVQNKPGAGSQVGSAELVKAKPDGYTVGTTPLPTTAVVYLDPSRQAGFARKDFQPLANIAMSSSVIVVKADGPYKTLKDLVDDARARPGQVKMALPGMGTPTHLGIVLLEKVANVNFADVQFDGGPQGITALLGGHVDAYAPSLGTASAQVAAGSLRVLGVMNKDRDALAPGIPTFEEQGYKGFGAGLSLQIILSAPAGTPKEVVAILSGAVKNAMEVPEVRKKLEESGQTPLYMDVAGAEALWAEVESTIAPLVPSLSAK